MAHARVEELSDTDSDPEIMDLAALPSTSHHPLEPNPTLLPASAIPSIASAAAAAPPPPPAPPPAESKTWQVLYPIYFDARASRAQGRRVGREEAVRNPLAQTIAEAVRSKGWSSVFEPVRTHPGDWANPGRVRVKMRDEDGRWIARGVKNKHHLYLVVSEYLRSHPTGQNDPLKLQIRGLPMPEGTPPAPAVPRGWHINEIVPLHSSAMTGGGVSENMLQDFQAAMQGQDPSSSSKALPESSSKKKKKEKEKGKKK